MEINTELLDKFTFIVNKQNECLLLRKEIQDLSLKYESKDIISLLKDKVLISKRLEIIDIAKNTTEFRANSYFDQYSLEFRSLHYKLAAALNNSDYENAALIKKEINDLKTDK